VFEYEGRMGYLNDQGIQTIAPLFDVYPSCNSQSSFINGFAKLKKDGKYGIIDVTGKFMLPATYDNLGEPLEIIAFQKGSKWGFIDRKGKVVLPAMFDAAQSFVAQTAIVETMGKKGVINPKGDWIIPAKYEDIRAVKGGLFLAYSGVNWGVFTSKGEQKVPENYTQIRFFQKDYLILSNQEDVHYFYIPDEIYILPRF
jgi:hypothetical protein